jgi:zinc transporter 2
MDDQPEIQSPLQSKQSIEEDNLLFNIPVQQDHSGSFRKLIIVSIMCIMFIAGEIIGGIISHSISVISDATHLITDLIGFILSFVFLYYSSKHADDQKSFGFHRLEIVGALANLFIIWIVALFLIVESTSRIINKEFVEQPLIMLIVAGGGLMVNIGMYFVLHSGTGGHSHGLGQECTHSHSEEHQ